MNLYQKIVEVRKVAKGFDKDGKGFNYQYVTGNQILSKIRDKMNELNLLLIPSTKLGEHQIHNYKTSKGKDVTDFIVSGEMSYTWIDGDKPEDRLVIEWAYYGQMDEISRAYGSALTYSERYFLLKCLGLPTDEDDPDGKLGDGKPDNKATNKSNNKSNLSEGQVNRLYAIAKAAGVTQEQVKLSVKKDYGKDNENELTRKEYDELCKRLEKAKK